MLLKSLSVFINESVDSKNNFKAIFLAGGAGSGKGAVSADIFDIDKSLKRISATGLKVINIDDVFEYLLKKNGMDPKDIENLPKDSVDKLFGKATGITNKRFSDITKNREGLIIDSTAAAVGNIRSKKAILDKLGYDTTIIFVDTELEVALRSNKNRSRVLPDDVVKRSYENTQKSKAELLKTFDEAIVVNNDGKSKVSDAIKTHVNDFLKKEPKSELAKEWIAAAKNPLKYKNVLLFNFIKELEDEIRVHSNELLALHFTKLILSKNEEDVTRAKTELKELIEKYKAKIKSAGEDINKDIVYTMEDYIDVYTLILSINNDNSKLKLEVLKSKINHVNNKLKKRFKFNKNKKIKL